jgi:hypothetical protein
MLGIPTEKSAQIAGIWQIIRLTVWCFEALSDY